MTEESTTTNPTTSNEQPKNKQRIRLIFPYSENAELKKLGVKWNNIDKYWYYPSIDGTLPDNLKKYKAHKIFIEYEDKEYFKVHLKSMRFDKIDKVWIVNEEDYNKFLSFGN